MRLSFIPASVFSILLLLASGSRAWAQDWARFEAVLACSPIEEVQEQAQQLYQSKQQEFPEIQKMIRSLAEYCYPSLAEAYLERCKKNRRLQKAHAEEIEALEDFIADIRRQMRHCTRIQVEDRVVVKEPELAVLLRRLQAFFGQPEEKRFGSHDGSRAWLVKPSAETEGESLYYVYLQQGEQQQPQRLEGLQEGGRLYYPYMSTDGQTLYYAYQADSLAAERALYVTRFAASKERFLKPQRLSYPFNAPLARLLYLENEELDLAAYLQRLPTEPADSLQQAKRYELILFRPSKAARITESLPEDSLREICLLQDSLELHRGAFLQSLLEAKPGDSREQQTREVLFYTHEGKPIEQDPQQWTGAAGQLLEEYSSTQEIARAEQKKLAALRQSYAKASPQERGKLQKEILFLEARQQTYPERLKGLRNAFLKTTEQYQP